MTMLMTTMTKMKITTSTRRDEQGSHRLKPYIRDYNPETLHPSTREGKPKALYRESRRQEHETLRSKTTAPLSHAPGLASG